MICRYMRMDASIILDEIDLEGKKKNVIEKHLIQGKRLGKALEFRNNKI